MNERAARNAVLVRALETSDAARELATDADRVWATRTAAEAVGESGSEEAFLDSRARLLLDRLAKRYPKVAALARPPSRRALLPLAVAIAFIAGVAGVDISPEHRINLLAPPVLGVLAWNLAVYVTLVVAALLPRAHARAPLRARVGAFLRDLPWPSRRAVAPPLLASALSRFAGEWSSLATPLWRQRAATLLHLAAAALAAGMIGGLYLRGIALEYRAAWQSTFLDAGDVARVLHTVLAPGAWLTGIAIPDASHLQRIGAQSAGENAAPWIHLYAATILLIVIAPRLVLALVGAVRARRIARSFPLPLGEPYFERLLRAWRQGTAQVVALPYSYAVPEANARALGAIVTRAVESSVHIDWQRPTAYGDEALPVLPSSAPSAFVVVFNLSATPEQETHGAFADAVAKLAGGRTPLVGVVDSSDFVARFGDQPRRIAERETVWRQILASHGVDALFVRLAQPDVGAAACAMSAVLEQRS